jgi:hypothetical protein
VVELSEKPAKPKKVRKPVTLGELSLIAVLVGICLISLSGFTMIIADNCKPHCYIARRCESPWRGWELHEHKGFWFFQVENKSILGESFKTEGEVRIFMKKWLLRECAE